MRKRSFFSLAKPQFEYEKLEATEPAIMDVPKMATLLFETPFERKDTLMLKTGDRVKTGQKLIISKESDKYAVSSVTGTISSVYGYSGDFGKSYTAVAISADENEEMDEEFKNLAKDISLDNALKFLGAAPGVPKFSAFCNAKQPIKIIVIQGVDRDLMVTTNQYAMQSLADDIDKGISILKQITGIQHIIIAKHANQAGAIGGASGAETRVIDRIYPSAIPQMIMKNVVGQTVPAGQNCEDMGAVFFSAESVASIGRAFNTGQIPVEKLLTLIRKDMSRVMVKARIGTPLKDIFDACGVTLSEKDRIIAGGPMTGAALYTEDFPVLSDTDAVMVQDSADVSIVSDYPCINCGECVRVCPAKIPVNMLIRFCEAGQYEKAAEEYDLYSCIECGLCSFVCVSRMPVFQYIRLAKYELARLNKEKAEETSGEEA